MNYQPAALCQCPKEKVIRVFTQNQSTGLCKGEGAAVSWRKVMLPIDPSTATSPDDSQAGAHMCVSPAWELRFSWPGVCRHFYWESRAMHCHISALWCWTFLLNLNEVLSMIRTVYEWAAIFDVSVVIKLIRNCFCRPRVERTLEQAICDRLVKLECVCHCIEYTVSCMYWMV